MSYKLFVTFLFLLFSLPVSAQDTLQIAFDDFVQMALDNAGQMKVADTKIKLAKNRTKEANNQRYLPSLNFRSEHAPVPGVTSPNGRDDESIYLDPDAYNDWDKIGLFTRVRISGAQPIFTWGAINKAVDAAELAVKATQEEYDATQAELTLRLHDLYYGYVLALEIQRLLEDADEKVNQIERAITNKQEDEPDEIDESDVYKFKVFKATFGIQKEEVVQNLAFVQETWNYLLRNNEELTYEPSVRYLEAQSDSLSGINYYQNSATTNRSEIRGLEFGKDALETYISSVKSQNLPGLYLGFTSTFAKTPIRPRQPNPFINTPENTINTAIGLTIRQNLNFFQIKTGIERSRLEVQRLDFLKEAATDGIVLEVNEAYQKAAVAGVKVEKTEEALGITKEWLRMEQLDYDFGIGEVKDLIDAMKQELELRLQEKQSIFEYKSAKAKLNKSAGLPLVSTTQEN